jgi:hypothetical protein
MKCRVQNYERTDHSSPIMPALIGHGSSITTSMLNAIRSLTG